MAKDMSPIIKRCRRLNIDPAMLGYTKKLGERKQIRRPRRQSEYALQLKEKQKVKFIYGILEKQCRLYYKKAERQRGITGENMLLMLERRLDNVIFRLQIAKTRPQARQFVSHGLITVNGKRINIPSYQIDVDDVIEIKANKKDKKVFEGIKENAPLGLPAWLEFDNTTLTGRVKALPTREDIKEPIQEHLIVELYSK